ncbi:hypothetical protein AAKU55_000976 [Oxalobacteraceae bacterium GrIS 1.11]
MIENKLPELIVLERLIEQGRQHLEVRTMCMVSAGGRQLPVYALALGNPSLAVPAVGFFGGIHGLERIGTQVLLAFYKVCWHACAGIMSCTSNWPPCAWCSCRWSIRAACGAGRAAIRKAWI